MTDKKSIPINKTELIRIATQDLDTICEGVVLKFECNEELIYEVDKSTTGIKCVSTLSRGFAENGEKIILVKDYNDLREKNEILYNLSFGLEFVRGTFHNVCVRTIGPNLLFYGECDKKLKEVNI